MITGIVPYGGVFFTDQVVGWYAILFVGGGAQAATRPPPCGYGFCSENEVKYPQGCMW